MLSWFVILLINGISQGRGVHVCVKLDDTREGYLRVFTNTNSNQGMKKIGKHVLSLSRNLNL